MAKKIDVGGELNSTALDKKLVDAAQVKDGSRGEKTLVETNEEIEYLLAQEGERQKQFEANEAARQAEADKTEQDRADEAARTEAERQATFEANEAERQVLYEKVERNTEGIELLNANTGISEYPEFSEAKAYAVGEVVLYEGLLKRFTSAHEAGAWDDSQVEAWSERKEVDGKVSELNSEFDSKIFDNHDDSFAFADGSGHIGGLLNSEGFKAVDFILPNNTRLSETVEGLKAEETRAQKGEEELGKEISQSNQDLVKRISNLLNYIGTKLINDESSDLSFVDSLGNIGAILNENGLKAVDFILPDGKTLANIASAIFCYNKAIERINIGGENGELYIADNNGNVGIIIKSNGEVDVILSQMSVKKSLEKWGNLINTYGVDYKIDPPSYVFGIESGTRTGREYFTNIYPEAIVRENIPLLINGSRKGIIQISKPQGFSATDIAEKSIAFSIGGNGYKNKDFVVRYIKANRNLAKEKNVGLLCIGDSITEQNVYFPENDASINGRGAWQDWLLAFNAMDNKDDNGISLIKLIGTKNYHPYAITYNGEKLIYVGHGEGRSGWATYGYLNYPCWARLDWAYEDVSGRKRNRLDAEAMYYAAGLATKTPYDSETASHEFTAWEENLYDALIAHTPMGRYKPDCCKELWDALKRLFQDFEDANAGEYASGSDAVIISYLNNLMDNPTNPFYDKDRAREYSGDHEWVYSNAFSLAKYLERYRNCDDEGNVLEGSAGNTTIGKDGKTYTIGTNIVPNSKCFMPTHVISALGTNDKDSVFVECQIELLNTLKEQGVSQVGYWLPRRPGVLQPQMWNEYGFLLQIQTFLYSKNNGIIEAIGALDINRGINYIPAYYTASPVSSGYVDNQSYDLDYIDKQKIVGGTDTVHESAFFMRSVAYQCLSWLYWTLQNN